MFDDLKSVAPFDDETRRRLIETYGDPRVWRLYRHRGTRAGIEQAIREGLPTHGIKVCGVDIDDSTLGEVNIRILLSWWLWPWAMWSLIRDHIVDVANVELEPVEILGVEYRVEIGWFRDPIAKLERWL